MLEEPRLKGVPPGSPQFFELQRVIIQERPLLREAYDRWYRLQCEDVASVPADAGGGILLELGSGGSYLKEVLPSVVTSDVTEGVAERVIDGRNLPFPDRSVRAILLSHVFHHIPDINAFLVEASRVLVPGGVVSMIEVPHTPFARFFFSCLHPEPYDDRAVDWRFDQVDVMTDANQALSWIVFFRDRERFAMDFPSLRLERAELLPWLGYLMSGGVTRREFAPRVLVPLIRALDRVLTPTNRWMALHWHLTLRKRE